MPDEAEPAVIDERQPPPAETDDSYDWTDPGAAEDEGEAGEPTDDKLSQQESGEGQEDASGGEEQGLDPNLLQIASGLGMPESAAKAFGSDEVLYDYLQRTLQDQQQPGQAQPAPGQQPPPAEQTSTDFKLELPEFSETEHGEETVRAWQQVQAMYDTQSAKLQQTEQAVQQLLSGYQEIANERYLSEFDAFLDSKVKAHEEYGDVLGSGPTRSLDPNGKAFRNRTKIDAAVDVIQRGFAARGQRVPPRQDVFESAFHAALADQAQEVARRQVSAKVNRRRSQAIARPASRDGRATQSPREDAKQALVEWLEAHGQGLGT